MSVCHLDAQASCNPGYTLQGKTCAAITCSLGENENCRTCRAQDARTAKDECDLAERFNDFNEQCRSETIFSSSRTHAAALLLKYLDYLPTHILSPQLACFSTICYVFQTRRRRMEIVNTQHSLLGFVSQL